MIYDLTEGYYVRGLREDDLSGPYQLWFQDQSICKYNSHGKFIKSEKWFREYLEKLDGESKLVWSICHNEDGHIGNISLNKISFINRNAEYAILIGDRRHWGKSVAFNASYILFDHAFNKLNLERIYCGLAATNLRMKGIAMRLGMLEEGVRRKHLYLNGQWDDALEYGILKDEFKIKHQKRE